MNVAKRGEDDDYIYVYENPDAWAQDLAQKKKKGAHVTSRRRCFWKWGISIQRKKNKDFLASSHPRKLGPNIHSMAVTAHMHAAAIFLPKLTAAWRTVPNRHRTGFSS